jgi:cytoskeletal protein CcmA (bactofilin family)
MKELLRSINQPLCALLQKVKGMRQSPQAEIKPSLVDFLGAKSFLMSDVAIEGDLHCDQNLVVDGHFKGTIMAPNNTVAIGPNGLVHADIIAKKVVIQGALKGDIKAECSVVLNASAKVSGNIQADVVDLENGARFKGIIQMDPQQEKEVIDVTADEAPKVESVAMEPN